MRNDAKSEAVALLRRYAISQPSLDDLVTIVTDMGFDLVDYDLRDDSMMILKDRLNLTESILAQEAFIYQNGDVKLLFIKDSLTGEEKLYAIAHELGHIVLGHKSVRPSLIEEHEANEFSHYLLHPQVGLRVLAVVLHHKRLTAIALVVLVVIISAVGYINEINNRNHYTDSFYITPNGTKYHRAVCSVIKDRTNARKMTRDEYESGNYAPCLLCVPED